MKLDELRRNARFHTVRGSHWILRFVGCAPDQLRARRLGRSMRHENRQPDSTTGPSVLFLTPRSWAAHVHWEAAIANALKLRGASVQFVTCGGGLERCDRTTTHESPPMPCASCTRYTNQTLRFYDLARQPMMFGTPEPWDQLDTMGLDQLLALEYRDIPIGQLVEIPTKWFLLNTQIETDPLGLLTIRSFLRSARLVVDQLHDVLSEKNPDVLVILNGLFFFESIAWAIARKMNIDVVNYERGYIIDTLMFDRDEPACFGLLDSAWKSFRDIDLTEDESKELNEYLKDRSYGRRAIEEYWREINDSKRFKSEGRRLVTLFANLTWDSAVINKEVAFDSIHSWIESTINYFCTHPEHDLIIRIHPAEVRLSGKPTREPVADFIRSSFPSLPANIRLILPDDPASSYVMMAESDVVTVLTSTTGLEAALNGVPVVVSGSTAYREKGFTVDVSDESEYWSAFDAILADPDRFGPRRDLVERYAHLFFFKLPIRFTEVTEHVRGVARINYRSVKDLAPGASRSLDRICDGILGGGRFRP